MTSNIYHHPPPPHLPAISKTQSLLVWQYIGLQISTNRTATIEYLFVPQVTPATRFEHATLAETSLETPVWNLVAVTAFSQLRVHYMRVLVQTACATKLRTNVADICLDLKCFLGRDTVSLDRPEDVNGPSFCASVIPSTRRELSTEAGRTRIN